jgi:prepilin-type N-terminal cleavage/methylation domain-containing protein
MPARSDNDDDAGFSLIELLVVMIVIGILASIAIPVFLNQRAKAHDTSTKADVTNLGKEVATYHVDGRGTPVLDFDSKPGYVRIVEGSYNAEVRLTNGTAEPVTGSDANLGDAQAWCVSLTDLKGRDQQFRYTAAAGLGVGAC